MYICHSLVIYSFNVIHQNTKIIEIDEEPYEKTLKKINKTSLFIKENHICNDNLAKEINIIYHEIY